VWGQDLKADLARLNEHYSKLPDQEKEKGIMMFAATPPKEGDYLVSKLWDRYLPSWRSIKSSVPKMNPETEKKIVERIHKDFELKSLPKADIDYNATDADFLGIHRMIRKRKGTWWQLPKDLKISDKKE
jgi:hypothetical protein